MAVAWNIRMVDWRTPYLPFLGGYVRSRMTVGKAEDDWLDQRPAVVSCHVRSGQVPIRRMAWHDWTRLHSLSDTKRITTKIASLQHLTWKPWHNLKITTWFELKNQFDWFRSLLPAIGGLKTISASVDLTHSDPHGLAVQKSSRSFPCEESSPVFLGMSFLGFLRGFFWCCFSDVSFPVDYFVDVFFSELQIADQKFVFSLFTVFGWFRKEREIDCNRCNTIVFDGQQCLPVSSAGIHSRVRVRPRSSCSTERIDHKNITASWS